MPKGLPISYIKKWGISKLAWKKFRAGALTKGVPTRTFPKKKGSSKGKSMARRRYGRRRRRSSGMTIPLAPIVGIIAMPGVSKAIDAGMRGDFPLALNWLKTIVGVWGDGSFHVETMINNLIPPIAGLAVHYIASRAGINRALGRAKVPLIRI